MDCQLYKIIKVVPLNNKSQIYKMIVETNNKIIMVIKILI